MRGDRSRRVLRAAAIPLVGAALVGAFLLGTRVGGGGSPAPAAAVYNAVILEEVARIAAITVSIAPPQEIDRHLLERHYLRKHGKDAYYGQKK